jgi:hypothetical protein
VHRGAEVGGLVHVDPEPVVRNHLPAEEWAQGDTPERKEAMHYMQCATPPPILEIGGVGGVSPSPGLTFSVHASDNENGGQNSPDKSGHPSGKHGEHTGGERGGR